MFWDKWIPAKFLVKSEVCAIEVCFKDDELAFYYTILQNKKSKLELNGHGSSIGTLELPGTIIKNKIPVLLIVTGRGIITKKVDTDSERKIAFGEIVSQNLPAVNAEEFFIQLFRQNNTAFISICRKEQVAGLLKELESKRIVPVDILIGPASVIGLQPLWDNFNSLATALYKIELTNGEIDQITPDTSKEKTNLQVEGINIDHRFTLGLAGGLAYFVRNRIAETDNMYLNSFFSRHLEANKFRFLGLAVVAIAFITAVTNVIFYTGFFDKNNKLETELSVYQGKYDQINKLLSDYQKNKDLIENAGVLYKNRLSEFADRIAKTIPDEVSLSELYFNPKNESEESEDSLMTFHSKTLILRGNCSKSLIVNEWLNVLKMQKFIKDISLERFNYKNEGLLPNFEIKLVTE